MNHRVQVVLNLWSMIRNLVLLFCIMQCFLASCSNKTPASNHLPPLLIAWNQDTVNSYYLTLEQNRNFYYAIVKKEGIYKKTKSLKGTFEVTRDSVLLNYTPNQDTIETTNYLVKETSGHYLIQYFTTNKDRLFLRIQSTSPRW